MRFVARKTARGGLIAAVTTAAVLLAEAAHANYEFPARLAKALDMPCKPTCLVCHGTLLGGKNNFRKVIIDGQPFPGFGEHLHSLLCGLDGDRPESLEPALTCMMDMDPTSDVDRDGKPDLAELAVGQDPNDPATDAPLCGEAAESGPLYGCARVAPQAPFDDVALAVGAGITLLGMSALRRPKGSRAPKI
jgi:hypothetical protein